MSYAGIKQLSRQLGLYRASRWVHRNIMRRDALQSFREELNHYSRFFGKGDLCFDVGANNGIKSEVMLKLGAKVIAFEPQQDCIREIQARLGRPAALTLVAKAVGAAPGEAVLFTSQSNTAASLLPNWQGEATGSVRVPITTLDEAIATYGRPKFCKVDVEGFEPEVFKGLSQPIPLISFEYFQKAGGKAKAEACIDSLARFGDIRLNLATAEGASFALDRWMEREEFLDYFRNQLPADGKFWYGDIYVKTVGI